MLTISQMEDVLSALTWAEDHVNERLTNWRGTDLESAMQTDFETVTVAIETVKTALRLQRNENYKKIRLYIESMTDNQEPLNLLETLKP